MKTIAPERPFAYLVRHFVRRLFASEQEQGETTLGAGLGTILALLAAPGAFASLVLLDKYSSLLQYFRGQADFNPFRASISDEYFFVVLSMTITGLVMVLRWNRLLPDRRDFANLAVLPIPIRDIFLANFCALLGLALLFAIDVNAVSSVLFPLFVTMQNGTTAAFGQIFISHIITVFCASLFSFFAVFGLTGFLMLIVPVAWFKPVSLVVRIALVVALLTEFFSNLFLQLLSGTVPRHPAVLMRWVPSFWFLGIYERLAGLASVEMKTLGSWAIQMLAAAILISLISYTLCYQRHFRRLAESSSETLGGSHRKAWIWPRSVERLLFRSPFEHASLSFAAKVLCRSERHLMFLGGYSGVGLVIVADTTLGHAALSGSGPSADILSVPLLLGFFIVTGLWFVFEMPALLEANWVFRIAALTPTPAPGAIVSRMMMIMTVPLEIVVAGALILPRYGWLHFLLGATYSTACTALLISVLANRSPRLPFTFLKQHDTRALVVRMVVCLLSIVLLIPVLAAFEQWALRSPFRFVWLGSILFILWRVKVRTNPRAQSAEPLTFEDLRRPDFELLKIA